MRAGKLRSRATIMALVGADDALGQPSTTWQDVAVVWADVRFVSGIETIKAGREVSTSKASIQIRYLSGITAAMRINVDGVDYNIVDVVPDAKRAFLTLICEAVK